ncbi:LacI family DNA-binding transcriptional regulator [Halomonas sp. HG01]|uniref:LacI family DNA-binding transcriptional regulator n=1 Tax=Halomonas sp. HG01 TaxID=1609967 RepID=UPI000614721E|nr:LacI family DNA-binding transcriptional regulator [Halomonas sp. HG01]
MYDKPSSTPTMVDVARAAGVGVATVDRVFSGRARVRKATADKVLRAAKSLGYERSSEEGGELSGAGPATVRRLGFLLQKRTSPVYRVLAESLIEAARRYHGTRVTVTIDYCDTLDPDQVASALVRLGRQVEAIGVVATDHPEVAQAVAGLHRQGVPVFALLSELSVDALSAGFVGQDGRKMGRSAAWAMSRMTRPGAVGIITGSHRYVCQELYEIGFRGYFREKAPAFRVVEPIFSQEDPDQAARATRELLEAEPELRGLYVAGGGIEGVVETLRERSRQDLLVVGHDLTATTRAALVDGTLDMLLSMPRRELAERAVSAMVESLMAPQLDTLPRRVILPIDIFTPESV